MPDPSRARQDMLAHQILERGVRSAEVTRAMAAVPREAFVDAHLREFAYSDSPLPIAEGQTISQPYIVAYMIEALGLEGGERVLEVGTGSGYAAAVLSRIAGEVYTIERHTKLAHTARAVLERLDYANVHVREGDGTRGWPERKGFNLVAVEADWPDAARIDHYVRHREAPPAGWKAFARFPEWMWRNLEMHGFVEWLRRHNASRPMEKRASFHGLDLYSLFASVGAVLEYLERVDPDTARVARERYGCLTPWASDPATYGRMALTGRYRECEGEVTAMLADLLRKRSEYARRDGERFADAVHNARVVADAERYYRIMYYGSAESWNLRDRHMFETLSELMRAREPDARAVVWEHNSHVGDARATEMSSRGELNVGQLCREAYGADVYSIGFGTDRGTVAAADDWDGPMRVKEVRPSHPESYELQCRESGVPAFLLPLREPGELRRHLTVPRLERALGVVYRPQTELASHYFQAVLPQQFDEYCWIEQTSAVRPLEVERLGAMPETYPFGL